MKERKMRKNKKIKGMGRALTAFLLALVMVLSVVPTAMAAELPTKIDPPAQTDTATQPAEWEN
ncbi:MAG: hypothetical protein RR797_04140, partial [Christensenella sp.]